MKKAFTLIELMIAITITSILMMMTYAPYNYYSNKAKVKITAKEISQQLYDSRNLAIHGLDNGVGNLSVGVYFDSSEDLKDQIQIFSFTQGVTNILPDDSLDGISIIKTIKLKPGIQINSISGEENGFFVFDAITGDGHYSHSNGVTSFEFNETELEIEFSYGDSDTLKNKVTYFTLTNISDY